MVCDHLKVCSRKVNSEMLYALYYGQAFLFHGAVSCFPRQLFSRNGSGLINTWFETRASFRDLNASLLSGVQTILSASFFLFFAVSMYCNSSKGIVCIVTETQKGLHILFLIGCGYSTIALILASRGQILPPPTRCPRKVFLACYLAFCRFHCHTNFTYSGQDLDLHRLAENCYIINIRRAKFHHV